MDKKIIKAISKIRPDSTGNRVDKQAKSKRVREAKEGKRDFVEDVFGSEEISGTAEIRAKTAKVLALDRSDRNKVDHAAVEHFRQRRLQALEAQRLTVDQVVMVQKQVEYVLYHTCEPAAFEYLNNIRVRDQKLCNKICYALFPPEVVKNIDLYVKRIYSHGPPKNKIMIADIIKYERAFMGIKPRVEVEIDGKRVSLQEAVGARKIA